ncbi:hypothetical protein OHB20_47455 [Streptomyces canus]
MSVLGIQGVERDGAADQAERSEKRLELADLALLPGDLPLVQRRAFAVGDGCQQMHRLRRRSARSAQALAVDGDRAQPFVLVGAAAVSCKPRTHRRVHRVAVQTCQESAERGRPQCGPQPQTVTDLVGQVGGMPCDGGEGGGAGEYGDRAQCQDQAEPVTAALSTARIGEHVEDVGKVQQAVGVVGDGARSVVEVAGHSGNQRG